MTICNDSAHLPHVPVPAHAHLNNLVDICFTVNWHDCWTCRLKVKKPFFFCMQEVAMQRSAVQCSAVQCSAVQAASQQLVVLPAVMPGQAYQQRM